MNRQTIADLRDLLLFHGRTYWQPTGELCLGWTCAGISFEFAGTCLLAELRAVPALETEVSQANPFQPSLVQRETWPVLGVFVDDDPQPRQRLHLNRPTGEYLLYSSSASETHRITLRKLSENAKGKSSIVALAGEGSINALPAQPRRLMLEFVGDSITCGFGNASNDRDRLFFSEEEDGWQSHAAIAARQLDADFSIIAYSGIAAMSWPAGPLPALPAMADLYPYADRLAEEQSGRRDGFQPWDFAASRPDVIVVNLGTNDATVIEMGNLGESGPAQFEKAYRELITLIRSLNGPQPWIVCALGSMDYYLYDNIRRVVSRLSDEGQDTRICCFKYGRMRFTDGYGACGHPNLVTHRRMGDEIAAFIRQLTGKDSEVADHV